MQNFSTANGGIDSAEVDLFEDIDLVPDFFEPEEPVFASVEVRSQGTEDLVRFSIEHRGAITMFPLTSDPGAGNPSDRFIATGSQTKTIFNVDRPGGPDDELIDIELELEQDFELVDPIDSAIDAEIGTFFLIELEEIETGDLIDDLSGSSLFDSADDLEPDFEEPFNPEPGYDGFTSTTSTIPGEVDVEFQRTINATITEGRDIELETLVSQHIFSDGFESGDVSSWTMSSPNSFIITVRSADPNVRFNLKLGNSSPEPVLPELLIDTLPNDRVQIRWDALNSHNYTILFTEDLSLPKAQWQELSTVTGQAGEVTRDFAVGGTKGFYALRVSLP